MVKNKSNILLNISFFNEDYSEKIIFNNIFFENTEKITEIMKDSILKTNEIVQKEKEEEKLLSAFYSTYIIENKKKIDLNLDITKKELKNKIPEILDSIEIGENYILKGIDFTILIKATNSSYYSNLTHLNFQTCEDILRNSTNISNSRILTLFQVEIDKINKQSLVNQLEYQIYDDNKTSRFISM